MNGMFYYCLNLISIPDISNWIIKNVINIGAIFYECSTLTSLPDILK